MRYYKISSVLLVIMLLQAISVYAADLPTMSIHPISVRIPEVNYRIIDTDTNLDISSLLDLSDRPLEPVTSHIEKGLDSQSRARNSV